MLRSLPSPAPNYAQSMEHVQAGAPSPAECPFALQVDLSPKAALEQSQLAEEAGFCFLPSVNRWEEPL